MKNKIPAVLLAMGMLCSVAPLNASASTSGEFTYEMISDHVEITGFVSQKPETHASQTITIPAEIEGLPVTSIGELAFQNEQFSEIVFPDTLETIQYGAFQFCHSLQDVQFPDKLLTIGENAFQECWNLKEIVIPDSVTQLHNYAFSDCINLETVKLSNSLNSLETGVFFNCKKLDNFDIPQNIKSLSLNALMFTDFENITIPETVESVDYFALGWIENLKSVTFLNPNCQITDDGCTIFNTNYRGKFEFGGIIYGYENSTAQAYAQKYGYEFLPIGKTFVSDILGDISGDGKITIVDLIQMRKGILYGQALPKIGDMNGDNAVNVIDLALLKQTLLKNS